MSGIARWTGQNTTLGAPAPQPSARRTVGGAASTRDTEWGGAAELWDALPADARAVDPGGSSLVGEAVVSPAEYAGCASQIDGRKAQAKYGLRAYRNRLVIVTLVRPVVRAPGGGWVSAGPWTRRPGREVYIPSGVTVWSTPDGKGMATGPALTSTVGGGQGGGVPRLQQTGAEVSLYLPASVRDRAAAEVPAPTRWLGSLVQWRAQDGSAARQEIFTLRMDGAVAFVVVASRGARERASATGWSTDAMAARPWRLTWLRYELADAGRRSAPALSGRGRQQIGR